MMLVVYILGELGPPNITGDGPPTMISISCIQQHLLCSIICLLESEKSFQTHHFQYNKNHTNKYKIQNNVGMAIPKTTQTMCRDANVHAAQGIQTLHT